MICIHRQDYKQNIDYLLSLKTTQAHKLPLLFFFIYNKLYFTPALLFAPVYLIFPPRTWGSIDWLWLVVQYCETNFIKMFFFGDKICDKLEAVRRK